MRRTPLLLLLLLLGALPGCGGAEPGLRIDVETLSFDGAAPDGLRIRQLPAAGGPGAAYALEPVPDGRSGEYQASDAPDGAYVVEGPAGWWMLRVDGAPATLTRGLQPPLVALGRGRSLYVGVRESEVRPSGVWGAVRILDDGREAPVPVTVEVDDGGYVVALRFAPEDWHGTLQAVGRLAEGPPPSSSPGPEAPLSRPIRFAATPDGAPVVTRVQAESEEPLTVVLVPASAAVSAEGLAVRASVEGLPISSEHVVHARRDVARFPSVPVVDRFLRLQVGDAPDVDRLDPVARRRQATVRLLVTTGVPTRPVRVPAAAGVRIDGVQVRPAGAIAFGRVPFQRDGDGISFRAPVVACRVLLRAGDRWADVALEAGDEAPIEGAAYVEGVVAGGRVDRARPGSVVRFFREVGADGEAVLGDGFEVRVEPSGTFEARLPTGRYQVEVASQAGTWKRSAPLVARSPGARLHLPLESR